MNWTDKEELILHDNYTFFLNNKEVACNTFNRNWGTIQAKARNMDLCAVRKPFFSSCEPILKSARSYLDGLMLSDGYIPYRVSTSYYEQGCKEKQWLDKISEDLYEYGIECSISGAKKHIMKVSNNICYSYSLITNSYVEFVSFRDRWYNKDYNIDDYPIIRWHKDKNDEWFVWKKIVPKDIELTPECVLNFYLGDGSKAKNKYNNIKISTCGFYRSDVDFLSDLLFSYIGIRNNICNDNNIHITSKECILDFLNYMSICEVPSCYDHKFSYII